MHQPVLSRRQRGATPRKVALAIGEPRYAPPKPCPVCATSERYTLSGSCVRCAESARERARTARARSSSGWTSVTVGVAPERVALVQDFVACLADPTRQTLVGAIASLLGQVAPVALEQAQAEVPGFVAHDQEVMRRDKILREAMRQRQLAAERGDPLEPLPEFGPLPSASDIFRKKRDKVDKPYVPKEQRGY